MGPRTQMPRPGGQQRMGGGGRGMQQPQGGMPGQQVRGDMFTGYPVM